MKLKLSTGFKKLTIVLVWRSLITDLSPHHREGIPVVYSIKYEGRQYFVEVEV